MEYAIFATPWGWGAIAGGEHGMRRVLLPEPSRAAVRQRVKKIFPGVREAPETFARLIRAFERYFSGRRVVIRARLDLTGATAFQKRVWTAAAAIPYGTVRTYGQIAREMGMPGASRAVGRALGMNPLPIIIPCHRVIRSDGGMGGFSAAQGIKMKRVLLSLEGLSAVPQCGLKTRCVASDRVKQVACREEQRI